MTIAAIPTRYAGCHFRSRLEARWAVFFDTLGIPWEYEPQGFELRALTEGERYRSKMWQSSTDLCHLGHYLPDFWLPDQSTWFEVKGANPPREEKDRLARFRRLIPEGQHFTTATGGIPDPRAVDRYGHLYEADFRGLWWAVCSWCGEVDLCDGGTASRCKCREACTCYMNNCMMITSRQLAEKGWCGCTTCHTGNDPRILAACTAARSARFEHGQSGAT